MNSPTKKQFAYEALPLDGQSAIALLKDLLAENPDSPVGFFRRQAREGAETIVGWQPEERIVVRGTERGSTAFSSVAAAVSHYSCPGAPSDLPFKGGAVGYFAYESVRHVEPVLRSSAGSFRHAEESSAGPDAELIVFARYAVFDEARRKIHLFSLGREPDEALRSKVLGAQARLAKRKQAAKSEIPVRAMKSSMGKKAYEANVRRLKRHIVAGDIFQAVLSERFELAVRAKAPEIFEALVAGAPAPYLFYFGDAHGALMGASPELLLSCRGGEAKTHPIAGTRPRGKTASDEKRLERLLIKSPKERAEHLMLVDLARNDLGRISRPGTVRVTESFKIRKFPGVMHLTSTVNGTLRDDKCALDALASCFPAGTLSGAPKIRAMQLLSEIEKIPRGFYGGAFAAVSVDGSLESCITIRALEVRGGRAVLQAGAGIVADSNPAREYAEILHKTSALRKVLAQVAGKESR